MGVRINGQLPDLGKAAAGIKALAAVVVAKSAHDIEAKAKAKAPVDTGNLKNSITTDIAEDGMSAEVGPTASYASYVELGTARQAPQPYLIPAAEEVVPQFEKAILEIAEKAVDDA